MYPLSRLSPEELEALAARIGAQADRQGGWIEMRLVGRDAETYKGPEGAIRRVARNPFVLWALKDFELKGRGHEPPQWSVISPEEARGPADSPLHSDWVLSARLFHGEEYGTAGDR